MPSALCVQFLDRCRPDRWAKLGLCKPGSSICQFINREGHTVTHPWCPQQSSSPRESKSKPTATDRSPTVLWDSPHPLSNSAQPIEHVGFEWHKSVHPACEDRLSMRRWFPALAHLHPSASRECFPKRSGHTAIVNQIQSVFTNELLTTLTNINSQTLPTLTNHH